MPAAWGSGAYPCQFRRNFLALGSRHVCRTNIHTHARRISGSPNFREPGCIVAFKLRGSVTVRNVSPGELPNAIGHVSRRYPTSPLLG